MVEAGAGSWVLVGKPGPEWAGAVVVGSCQLQDHQWVSIQSVPVDGDLMDGGTAGSGAGVGAPSGYLGAINWTGGDLSCLEGAGAAHIRQKLASANKG